MQRMINTHIEASKIGRQIADQVLDYQRRLGDSSSGELIFDHFILLLPNELLFSSFQKVVLILNALLPKWFLLYVIRHSLLVLLVSINNSRHSCHRNKLTAHYRRTIQCVRLQC